MSFPGVFYTKFGEELNTYSDTLGNERYNVGQKMMLPDGRTFRFARTGGVTLVAGTLQQSSVPIAGFIGLVVPTAAAVNATSISATTVTTANDFEEFTGGVAVVESTGSGKGYYYPVGKNVANAAAGAAVIPLQTGYGVNPAISTADVVSLLLNPWKYVVIQATAITAPVVGVANFPAVTHGTIHAAGGNPKGTAMGDLCWIQTGGLCAVRQDASTVVAGQPVAASTATAGDVMLATTASTAISPFVGQCVRVAASGSWSTIQLMIADF